MLSFFMATPTLSLQKSLGLTTIFQRRLFIASIQPQALFYICSRSIIFLFESMSFPSPSYKEVFQ
jgi:hypothetical protein